MQAIADFVILGSFLIFIVAPVIVHIGMSLDITKAAQTLLVIKNRIFSRSR